MKVFSTTLVKSDKKLDFTSSAHKKIYEQFVNIIPDGYKVDVIFELSGPKATVAQIAKVHAACREIANHTGHTFDEIKLLVKERAGLILNKNGDEDNSTTIIKSSADCSKEEMSAAIEATEQLCTDLGINV